MTRRLTRREIGRRVDDLDDDPEGENDILDTIIYEDGETGQWYRDSEHTEPVPREDNDPTMIISETVVETSWERSDHD